MDAARRQWTVGFTAGELKIDRLLALMGMGSCVFLVWMLQHPYSGVVHDSILYSLLALTRLHPEYLANDIFLKYGSQDSYTIWSPLFAAAIRVLDLEPAAAVGTLLSQAAFFYGAWLLARRLMPVRDALLALGLLVALPANYGASGVFSFIEGFLTPRQITEACVLLALVAFIDSRWVLGSACLMLGMLLHPIIACAGIVMATLLYGVIPRPRLGLALLTGAFALSLAVVSVTASGPFKRFDTKWLEVINANSSFLFVLKWRVTDWIRAVPPLVVLAVGLLTTTKPLVRNFCWGALAIAGCGVLLTAVFCDWLKVQLVTEMQPWRWLWLEQAVAILMLPVIVGDCWRAGLATRAVTVLLASVWLLSSDPALVFAVALLAIASAVFVERVARTPREARLVLIGACAVLIIALVINIASKLLDQPILLLWTRDGTLYAMALLAVYWLIQRRPVPATTLLIALAGAAACACAAPAAWRAWSATYYGSLYPAMAQWRAAIPPQAEVLWAPTPIGTWYVLERPSYWSHHQEAGDIFSRGKAMEAYRRGLSLLAASQAAHPMSDLVLRKGVHAHTDISQEVAGVEPEKLNARGVARACEDPVLQYVVSWNVLGPTPFAPITPDATRPKDKLHLYRCADLRK